MKVRLKIEIYWQKVKFWAFFDMGCFRVIQNLVQILQACKVSSPTGTIKRKWEQKRFVKQDFEIFVVYCFIKFNF